MAELPHRVLIIDDDPSIRRLVEVNMVRLGYDVEIAASGQQAASMMSDVYYDLIILDPGMADKPNMHGYEPMRALNSTTPRAVNKHAEIYRPRRDI